MKNEISLSILTIRSYISKWKKQSSENVNRGKPLKKRSPMLKVDVWDGENHEQ